MREMDGNFTSKQTISFTERKEVMVHINTQEYQWEEQAIQRECGVKF